MHSGGKGTMFPKGGLPAWLNSGSWNLKWFATSGSHAAEHRWVKSLERTWQSIVNPGTTSIRAGRDYADQ